MTCRKVSSLALACLVMAVFRAGSGHVPRRLKNNGYRSVLTHSLPKRKGVYIPLSSLWKGGYPDSNELTIS
jgi:hypothetical protein